MIIIVISIDRREQASDNRNNRKIYESLQG